MAGWSCMHLSCCFRFCCILQVWHLQRSACIELHGLLLHSLKPIIRSLILDAVGHLFTVSHIKLGFSPLVCDMS